MRFPAKILIWLFAILSVGCLNRMHNPCDNGQIVDYSPKYAKGFRILSDSTMIHSCMVEITNPWQGASNYKQYVLLLADGDTAPVDFEGQIVNIPVSRVAVMSSSFVAMFDAIGEIGRIVGVSGLRYISNQAIVTAARADTVREIGYDSNLNFELLAAMHTDIVLLYGIYGEDKSVTSKLTELGIPYMFVGDYMESDPLGKAEWVVALAAMCDKRKVGEEFFDGLVARYELLRDSIAQLERRRPKVMLNTPYQDTWFMPSTESYAVRLIEDAGGEYVYPSNNSTASVPVSIETALMLANDADVWLNVGRYDNIDDLCRENSRFANVKPVRERRVFNNIKRMTPSGGSDFWESGAIAPDVVLSDMIKILHDNPTDESLYYYKKLD